MILPGIALSSVSQSTVAFLTFTGVFAAGSQVVWDPQFLIYSLIFVGLLLVGALIIAVVQRWRQLADRGGMSASDQLAQFRSLYEEGALSEEEFQRLRALLGSRIRQEAEAPADKAPARAIDPETGAPVPHETNRQNPSRSPDPPQTGIRQA